MTLLLSNILQSIKYYGALRRYNWSMLQCRNFMRNLYDVAALPFQAPANYGTWLIDFVHVFMGQNSQNQ